MATKAKISKRKSTGQAPIEVHYIKTSNYRTYHVDGIYGGLTPNHKIYIDLFVQRGAVPKSAKHEITEEGFFGAEVPNSREGKKGIVREIESGLVMDIETAKVLKNWLDQKIKLYEGKDN